MKPSNVIISDITNMKEEFCIAGWDIHERRMKRLLIDGGYWNENQVPQYSSIIVNNEPLTESRDYPHRTEDVNIEFESINVQEVFEPGKKLANLLRESASKDIQTIFGGKVKESSYVPKQTKCASLGAILIKASDIEFHTENGKLRAKVVDYSGKEYDLKVSCKYVRDIFGKTRDVETLNEAIASSQYAHCRIGLARPFMMQENHCYLMLNGLFLY
jgi:hypothetical protein